MMRKVQDHVYVFGFSDGIVKVGRTTKLKNRTQQHSTAAKHRGATLTGKWSTPHWNAAVAEAALINMATAAGGTPVPGSREYFQGLDFASFVQYVKSSATGNGASESLFSLVEAARMTGVSPRYFEARVKDGTFPTRYMKWERVISESDLQEWFYSLPTERRASA